MLINQPHQRIKAIRTILIVTVAVLVAAASIWILTADRREPASREEMRQHLLSQISDGDIRDLYDQAYIESAMRTAQRAQNQAMAWDDRCVDIAYRTRHRTECAASSSGHGVIMPSVSPDAVFDELLLGLCNYTTSKHDARQKGCLP